MRIVSGIRPTGDLHLGNYFGAITQFLDLQKADNECFFFVADLHALTTFTDDKQNIDALSIEVLRLYLAAGIDPKKAVIYRQSDIPEIPYLTVLLSMIAPEGELRRCTTYKEKAQEIEQKRATLSLGLLSYPVLMAADVLFCNAECVPVGEDQLQHLEIIREIARRYNSHIGKNWTFTEPEPLKARAIRVPGLLNKGKMSKSSADDDCLFLMDTPKAINKKVMAAVTDSGPVIGEPPSPPIANLFALMKLCCNDETVAEYEAAHKRGDQKYYGSMKKALADGVVEVLQPIQERYETAECSAEFVRQILFENSERVRYLARKTLSAVLTDFGLNRGDRGNF